MIRPLAPETDAIACDAIIASLPGWFGLEEGIAECAAAVRSQPGLVAEMDGSVVGFLTVARPYPTTPEISWLAVRARDRRRGIGRALIDAISERCRADGDRILLVKTLSDREDPGPEYAETRAFYLALGFVPVVELDLHIRITRSNSWRCRSDGSEGLAGNLFRRSGRPTDVHPAKRRLTVKRIGYISAGVVLGTIVALTLPSLAQDTGSPVQAPPIER